MSKHYETMFILKPTLSEEEAAARIEQFSQIITNGGGEVVAIEKMGVRPLAYMIEKFERGNYVVIYYKADGSVNKELERVYRITEDIIRFILIKYEKKVEVENWENMVNRAKGLPFKEVKLTDSHRERGDRPRKPRFDPDKKRAPKGETKQEQEQEEE